MPTIKINDLNMYYEIHGQGEPLVMIMGIRRDLSWFYRQIPFFSKHYQTVVFDNRGAGKTDKPDEAYTIQGMAEDTAGLMKALGITSAHVLGVSMGGYIAQELALNHPQKVKRLILGCTSCGGERHIAMPDHIFKLYTSIEGLTPEQILRKDLPIFFSDRYIREEREEVEDFISLALKVQQPQYAFIRQFQAAMNHDTCSRLSGLTTPTLILTGADDELVPAQNSSVMKDLIPGARLIKIEKGRHCFFIEMADQFNEAVLSFLMTPE
jgi:pimeloyl-ACP methyl ester carboxylesterase